MTTHLECHSPRQRMAQANALRELHMQSSDHQPVFVELASIVYPDGMHGQAD